jgi:ribosome-associated protein
MSDGIFVIEGVQIPEDELMIRACRASGAGGQHVNKTNTKVQIMWTPGESVALTAEQKSLIRERLRTRLSRRGVLTCSVDKHRSQSRNIDLARQQLADLVAKALFIPKVRKATRPTKGAKERRLKAKKMRSNVKAGRQQKDWS